RDHVLLLIDLPERCRLRRRREHATDGESGTPAPLAEDIHGGPIKVPGRIFEPPNTIPAFPQGKERVLHDFLRFRRVPRDDAQPPEQRPGLGLEEGLEVERLLQDRAVLVRSPYREPGWISPPDRWIHEAPLTLLRLRKSHHAIAEALDRRLPVGRGVAGGGGGGC